MIWIRVGRMCNASLALSQSYLVGRETRSCFSPSLAMLVLPWWSKIVSQNCCVVFDAGGCKDLVTGCLSSQHHCEMGPCCFISTGTVVAGEEIKISEATHQRFHKESGTECRFWPGFLWVISSCLLDACKTQFCFFEYNCFVTQKVFR